jgi:predicted O-linked N-acetylglucosamine transferase (SPINDLY family)
MTNLGLDEWVAQDEQEYEDKAVSFAQDISSLINLRAGMRERMLSSPVMDAAAFARDVAHAFKGMWQKWVDDQKIGPKN